MRRALALLLATCVLAGLVVLGAVRVVLPPAEPPLVRDVGPGSPRLTQHLLLVVVDGLRWDVATDPRLMPELARRLREDTGGELWAGRVSMTTSAVLTFGTGQRGALEQIVRNVNPAPPAHDSWLAAAHEAGLHLAVAGDAAWGEMYGPTFDQRLHDPPGASIDVDFNPQTFRDTRKLLALAPDVLIAHFVTPDHQGHAWGIRSERYQAHVRGYDAELARLLLEVGPAWTTIVLGDHGAADSGTHGSDVAIQRRTFVTARGPGIAPGRVATRPLDQVDVPGTLSTLLGLRVPRHSRGHLWADWLALPEQQRAEVACHDTARVTELARALDAGLASVTAAAAPCESADPAARIAAARAAAVALDRAVDRQAGALGAPSLLLSLALAAIALVSALVALGRASWSALPGLAVLAALGVLLTWGVERLPGGAPRTVRITLFVLLNLPLLALLAWPGRVGAWLAAHPRAAVAALPGVLLASYTTNAQPELFVAVALASLLFTLTGGLEPEVPTLRAGRRVLPLPSVLALGLALLVLSRAGLRDENIYPAWLASNARWAFGLGAAALATSLTLVLRRDVSAPRLALLLALTLGSLLARRYAPAWLGRGACALGLGLALLAAAREQRAWAVGLGLAAFTWVSRDLDFLGLGATLVVADRAGLALAASRARRADPQPSLGTLLLSLAFLLGLAFVQRVSFATGIDINGLDWGAGGFGDAAVPAWFVGTALVLKYVLAWLLALGTFVRHWQPAPGERLLKALVTCFAARAVFLWLVLLVCQGSFWTALRTLSDLPFALIGAFASALLLVARAARRVVPSPP